MTLHEIEETVHTLASRHKGLDEAMLVTLLDAGGWEEKDIEEGKLIFRTLSKTAMTQPPQTSPQEELALPPVVDVDHLLPEHAEPEVVQESLVVDAPHLQTDSEELPHNLPLRPFETSEHIWPFSRYRDVFYGDVDTSPKKSVPAAHEPVVPPPAAVPTPSLAIVEAPRSTVTKKIEEAPPVAHIAPAQLSKGDEKLVIMAAIALLVVLLLLGYMYQNGRL